MGAHNRPTTCAATNKRLRAKSWYYRNGQYFYNKRAYEAHRAKAAAAGGPAAGQAAGEAPPPPPKAPRTPAKTPEATSPPAP
jgi:hypothetical protein